jgi:hypothetical protein
MKKITSIIIATIASLSAFSQNNVGIGTATPAASAALDITSTTKGLLIPRMTTTERTAIVSPAKGLMLFDNTTNTFWFHNGTAWVEINGGNGGNFSLPYSGAVASAGDALNITNTGAGAAITGNASANSVAAIEGNSTASVGGNGVLGSSTSATGAGVGGINATGTAVSGFSSGTGTALRGVSTSGYGLVVSGNLRLTGGNTNPVEGAVLTCVDANGNAVWKPRKVAFNARQIGSPNIADETRTTMFLNTESFDSGNDFNIQSAATDPNTFIVPITGVYHLSASSTIFLASTTTNIANATMELWVNGITIESYYNSISSSLSASSSNYLFLNRTVRLVAGDKVKIVLQQSNGGGFTAEQLSSSFSGHLIFAE